MIKTGVFIVDKDVNLIDAVSKRFLLESDCEIKGVAQTGFEAYQKIQASKPDIIVLNTPLVDVEVTQLISAIKTLNPDVTFICVFDTENPSIRQHLQSIGIENILVKPYDTEYLIRTVKDCIARKHNINKNSTSVSPFTMSQLNRPDNTTPAQQPQQPQNPFEQNPFMQQNPFATTPPIGGVPFGSPSSPSSPFTGAAEQHGLNMGTFTPQFQQPQMGMGSGFKTIKQAIFAIHCPKGGVGKTSVSTNVATAFSMVKIGKQPLRVLLVDMDLEFGDVCITLGMQPRPSIMNWVADIKSKLEKGITNIQYTQAQIEQFLITYPKTGLKVLAAPPSHNDVVEITDQAIKIILENLKNNGNFDIIIFDCGNNTNNYTLFTLLAAHAVYEIITMDLSAMSDLNMLLKTLRGIGFPMDKIKLVINRLPKNDKEFSIEEIANALGISNVAGVIPEYEKVRVRNNAGEPLVLDAKDNPFTVSIKNLCNTMMGVNLFTKARVVGGNTNSAGGIFSRLFKKR